jgi:hypothetical protein
MASSGISLTYWIDEYPILLESLAAQTPGMTVLTVAEMLDDLDFELAFESTEQGEFLDVSDSALIGMYLALL